MKARRIMSLEDMKRVLTSVLNVSVDLRDYGNHMSQDTVRLIENDITLRIGNVIMEVENELKGVVVRA